MAIIWPAPASAILLCVLLSSASSPAADTERTHRSHQRSQSEHSGDRTDEKTALKTALMHVLGIGSAVPAQRTASREQVPEYMWTLYRNQQAANRRHKRQSARYHDNGRHGVAAPYSGNTVRSYIVTGEPSFQGRLFSEIAFLLLQQLLR